MVGLCCDLAVDLNIPRKIALKRESDSLQECEYYFIQKLPSMDLIEAEFDIVKSLE
jgi:hypothetical protein